ncbi:MAG: methionyl-tRNA formyltransferase [Verrucomicrobia bacterium]|nr:methionyl-tRNA formyltransferase [Verrucomicrobiota bacterium]
MGSDPISLPLLNWLAGEGKTLAEVIGVFTQPDRPVGRGQKITANAIKTWALERNLPVFQPEKLTEDVRQQHAAFGADVALVMAYGQILKDDFIATPRLGTLNLHASILPKYRGASPIQTAIASGETETGVSLMRIVRKLDAGPVADVECVSIQKLDTAIEIESKLAAACVPLLARTLPKLSAGTLEFVAQDEAKATFCRKLVKADGVLDFSLPAAKLAAHINGLFPWPACTVEINGQLIKIGQAEEEVNKNENNLFAPGVILKADRNGLFVATDGGILKLLRLQRPGGKMLAASDFLLGFPIQEGAQLTTQTMPALLRNP